MRKILLLPVLALVALAYTSCKNDLNILAPYKSITVVYGLLDQNDTAHYIRVNKAYEGPGDAYQMAKQFDSIYFPVNQITVQLWDTNSNGNFVQTITLRPDSSIPLSSGTFSFPKQILYKTKAGLNVYDKYTLVITNEKTGKVLRGTTTLLTDVSFPNLTGPYLPMSFYNTNPSKISWSSVPNGRIYQMDIRFYYFDSLPSGSAEKYIDWVFPTQTASSIINQIAMSYGYTGQQFLQLVSSSIPVVSGAYRRADSIQVIFTTGSDDFNTYIQLSQPSLGIDQDKPSFTNVKNGIGLFTSRHIQVISKLVSSPTRDSLILNSTTAPLNFH